MATADEIRRAREATSIFSGLFDYIRANEERLAQEGRRSVLGGLFSKEPVYGTATNRYEGVLPLLASLAEPLARAIDAPRAAYEDLIPREDMLNEAFGTAGAAMMGGGLLKPSVKAGDLEVPSGMTQADVRDLFPEEAYHFMKSNRMIGDVLRPPSNSPSRFASRFDRLGVHVGTPAQAEDRYRVQVGSGSREQIDRELTLLGKDTGMTLPLQLRTEKPFEIKDFKEFGIDPDVSHSSRSFEIDGKTVLSEDGVRAVLNEFADARNLDLDTALDVFRKELTDRGYTNIPYVNMIEGVKRSETYVPDPTFKPENISNIMLVDRTAGDPAVIKSRFAAFRDAYDPSIMAAVPIGGLLGYNMLSQQQAERNNQGLLY